MKKFPWVIQKYKQCENMFIKNSYVCFIFFHQKMVFLLNKTLNYSIAEPEHIINIIRNDESLKCITLM